MADPKQIELELREYISKESNLRRDDRLPYLMAIINKHFSIDKIDHMVSYNEFMDMMSTAKASYATTVMPMSISNKKMEGFEVSHVLMMEAFIGYLNKNKLLKRLVKFNYTR